MSSKFKAVVEARQGVKPPEEILKAVSAPRGRPPGKRTDPAYRHVSAYIRRETHHQVKLRLLQQGQGREFSELVEELLAGWLESEKKGR